MSDIQDLRDRLEKRGVLAAEGYKPPENVHLPSDYRKKVEDYLSDKSLDFAENPTEPDLLQMYDLLVSMQEGMGLMQRSLDVVVKEVLFTSSATQFSHLLSGVELYADGRKVHRMPPAPDWNTLEAYVAPLLQNIVDHIKGASILADRAKITGLVPLDVLKGVDVVGDELLAIVRERGRSYGEESILALGENGMIMMIMAKVMRLMWSHKAQHQFRARKDSYIDLAGYCLLTIALDKYIKENSVDTAASATSVSGGTSTASGQDAGGHVTTPA